MIRKFSNHGSSKNSDKIEFKFVLTCRMSCVRVCMFYFLFLSCLFSALYESLEIVWFMFSKFLTIRPSCERYCLILFSHVFLNILFLFNKFYRRNFVPIY